MQAIAPRPRTVPLSWAARVALLTMAFGVAGVFVTAWRLDPWDGPGRPKVLGTHEQLGLGPCSFRRFTGWPCPTCGLTTSFSHAAHGDWGAALRAHVLGLPMALTSLVLGIGCLVGAVTGRGPNVAGGERWVIGTLLAVVAALLVVWGLRIAVLSALGNGPG
jgi:hypothetical protein